jgi:hypothetical protein
MAGVLPPQDEEVTWLADILADTAKEVQCPIWCVKIQANPAELLEKRAQR